MEQKIGDERRKKEIYRKDTRRILQINNNGGEEKHTGLHMGGRDRKNQVKNIPGEKTRQLFTKHKSNGRQQMAKDMPKRKNDSRWDANFRRRQVEWGELEIPTKVMSWEAERTRDTMKKAIKKGIELELQEDWTKIENSSYFSIYKKNQRRNWKRELL